MEVDWGRLFDIYRTISDKSGSNYDFLLKFLKDGDERAEGYPESLKLIKLYFSKEFKEIPLYMERNRLSKAIALYRLEVGK